MSAASISVMDPFDIGGIDMGQSLRRKYEKEEFVLLPPHQGGGYVQMVGAQIGRRSHNNACFCMVTVGIQQTSRLSNACVMYLDCRSAMEQHKS